MDEHSAHEHLLSSGGADAEEIVHAKQIALIFSRILKIVMWLLFIAWVVLIFLYPLNSVKEYINTLINDSTATFLGISGPMFLIYSGPVLVIAFLSVPFLLISGKQQIQEMKKGKHPSYGLWTFPLLVDGPLGVVTAAEFIGILLFVLYVTWAVCVYAVRGVQIASAETLSFAFQIAGVSFAYIGIFIVTFLFIPIARGSMLLRLLNIPFGHAAGYHKWLGHLIVLIFTLHGLCYGTVWTMEEVLLQEITAWADTGVANLAGVIGLSSLVLIWLTSLPPVRKQCFEVFYYTHHLYIIFIVFLALHVGVIPFSIVAGSIFLFMLDRFLRFCQSRNTVDIVSATCFPGGFVKLVLPKPQNLRCDALSFVFLRVPDVSRLQWHPFSVSAGGEHHISVLIKAVGEWTTKINQKIFSISGAEHGERLHDLQPYSRRITASVEGPYMHEFPHHLMYEKLVLAAGGIGISPFLAVLSDIYERLRQGKPCLLKNLVLVWAVKRSNELPLLSTIDINSICPYLSNEVNLDVLIYVTQESEPPLEEGTINRAIKSFTLPVSNGKTMSVLTASGNTMWFGIYLISATIGFMILLISLNIFYIKPNSIPRGWYQGLLFLACMVASVFIFGGLVVGFWHFLQSKISEMDFENITHFNGSSAHKNLHQDLASSTKIRYGSRPDFEDILGNIRERGGYFDVGVIVCGPWSLQSSVARDCRSLNTRRQLHHPIFHFHSHSFSL